MEGDCQGDKNRSSGIHAQRNSEETWERLKTGRGDGGGVSIAISEDLLDDITRQELPEHHQ